MKTNKRHLRSILIILILLILFFVMLFAQSVPIRAAQKAEGYELLQYDQSTVVKKTHEYDVRLKLTIQAPGDLEAVNVQLPNGNFVLNDIHVRDYDFDTVTDDAHHTSLRILPRKGSFGRDSYTFDISYRIQEHAQHEHANDMFYYDAVSPNWSVPIKKLKLTVKLPEDFDWSDLQYYAGQYGTEDVSHQVSYHVRHNTVRMTGERLPANFGITFKAQLPDGYWQNALDSTWMRNFALLVMLGVLLIIGLFWVIGGRDPKVRRTKETHPMDGVSPADIGYILYGRTRIRDIAVLIVYMAIKGYLQIVEYRPKQYQLIKREEPKDEARFIRTVYNTMFEDVYEGRTLEMDRSGMRIRRLQKIVSDSVESAYNTKDMRACTTFSKVLRACSIALLTFGIMVVYVLADLYNYQNTSVFDLLVIGGIAAVSLLLINRRYDQRYDVDASAYRITMTGDIALYIGLLIVVTRHFIQQTGSISISIGIDICAVLAMVITLFMKSRARGNAVLVARILGMRRFMQSTRTRDLAAEPSADRSYFYEMLPYALQFSVEEIWARKFRWLGHCTEDFFQEELEGNTIAQNRTRLTPEILARDLKMFCRTSESAYYTINRRRRIL